MHLNRGIVGTLFRTELRMLLRDRRTVITSIVLPLLIMPIMLFATSGMQRAREKKLDQTVYQYAITGPDAAVVRDFIATVNQSPPSPDGDSETDIRPDRFRSEEVFLADAAACAAALEAKKIHFYLETLPPAEVRAERQAEAARLAAEQAEERSKSAASRSDPPSAPEDTESPEEENWREPLVDGAPVVRLVYRADRDDSGSGMWRMRRVLAEARGDARDELLLAANFPVPAKAIAPVSENNLATGGQVAGLAFGRVITLFVLLFIMSGCAVAATDSIAGEKERGTLETLLTTAATRLEIIVAKHLAVLAVAVAITLVQAGNLLVYVGFKLIPVPANFAEALSPGVILLLLVMFLPLTVLAASVLLLTSGYAKSYKEAQLYFTPVFLLGILFTLAPFLPGLPLRSAIAFLPVSNIAVGAREILTGNVDWPFLVIAWLVTAAAAAFASRLSVRSLGTEKLITATETDAVDFAGGSALFSRKVGRWFLVMWALLLLVSGYEAKADLRVQVVINLVGLFFGGSLLMMRRYRLEPRTTLALRLPRPMVWLAVVCAIPAAILTGMGVLHLSEFLFPVSPEFVRDMAKAFSFDGIPTWQLVLFIGVFPGFFEEITFRGLLLHGLHRRLHPLLLVLVVGIVFGLFHVTLPRIIPTAFLGVLFTATVLLTGSIYPAMLWHAANNIIMVLVGEALLPELAAHPHYGAAGAFVLALCFLVMWWHRTPYPGLRPWRAIRR